MDNLQRIESQLKVVKNFARKEIPDFVRAHIIAEGDTDNRAWLMDIYERILIDGNLTRDITNRKSKVLGESFSLMNAKGERDPEKTKLLNQYWFTSSSNGFLSEALDAKLYGFSLIGLHQDGDKTMIGSVERRNVLPKKRMVVRRPGDKSGVSIDDFSEDYMLIYDGLGLLLKAVPLAIMKRDMREYWAEHGEIFGLDMLVGKTDTDDPGMVENMKASLRAAGRERIMVLDTHEEFEPKEMARSDAYKIYQEFIKDMNQEMSRLIKGHDSESSNYSESNLNRSEAEEIAESDKMFCEAVVNQMLLPMLAKKQGVYAGLDAYTFQFNERERTPLPERRNNLIALVQAGYEIAEEDIQAYLNLPFEVKKARFNVQANVTEDTL